MRLKEYQGKRLFKKYGISIPRGKLITSIQPRYWPVEVYSWGM